MLREFGREIQDAFTEWLGVCGTFGQESTLTNHRGINKYAKMFSCKNDVVWQRCFRDGTGSCSRDYNHPRTKRGCIHRLSSKVNGSLCFPGLPRVVLRGNPSGFWRSSHRRHRPRVDDVRHLPAWRQIALKQIWGTRHCMLSEDESVNFLIHLISYHCKSWWWWWWW